LCFGFLLWTNPAAFRANSGIWGRGDERYPQEANLGLSCGNPLAFVPLEEGQVVDLRCGAGMDCFLAAQKVGPRKSHRSRYDTGDDFSGSADCSE